MNNARLREICYIFHSFPKRLAFPVASDLLVTEWTSGLVQAHRCSAQPRFLRARGDPRRMNDGGLSCLRAALAGSCSSAGSVSSRSASQCRTLGESRLIALVIRFVEQKLRIKLIRPFERSRRRNRLSITVKGARIEQLPVIVIQHCTRV